MSDDTSLDGCLRGMGYIGCGAAGIIAGMSTVSGDLGHNAASIVMPALVGLGISSTSGAANDYITNRQLAEEKRRTRTGLERECVWRPMKGAAVFAIGYVMGSGIATLCYCLD